MTGCCFLGAVSFLLASVFCASNSFCGEIGSNSISFLTALPLSRTKIWAAKVAVGLISLLLSIVGVCSRGRDHPGDLRPYRRAEGGYGEFSWAQLTPCVEYTARSWAPTILAAIGCFAVSLTVSLLSDRALASAALSIVACLAITAISLLIVSSLPMNWGGFSTGDPLVVRAALLQIPPVFFAASYYIFVNGETLRTRKKFGLLGKAIGAWATLNATTFFVISLFHTL